MSNAEHPTFRLAVSGLPAAGDDSLSRQGVDVRCVPRPNAECRLVFHTTAGVINLDLQRGTADANALVVFFDGGSLEAIDAAAEVAKAHPGLLTAMCARRPTATGETLADCGFKASALALLRELTATPGLDFVPPAGARGGAVVATTASAWADVVRRPAAL